MAVHVEATHAALNGEHTGQLATLVVDVAHVLVCRCWHFRVSLVWEWHRWYFLWCVLGVVIDKRHRLGKTASHGVHTSSSTCHAGRGSSSVGCRQCHCEGQCCVVYTQSSVHVQPHKRVQGGVYGLLDVVQFGAKMEASGVEHKVPCNLKALKISKRHKAKQHTKKRWDKH